MAEPANHLSPAPRLVAAESAMRPKVLRRPAQFSAPAAASNVVSLPGTRQELPMERPPVAPSPRVWQDDGHFGIALMVLLLVVNGAAALWLSHTPKDALIITQSPSAPSSSNAEGPGVHVLGETH